MLFFPARGRSAVVNDPMVVMAPGLVPFVQVISD